MPAQPVHRPRALGDKVASVIAEQANLHRLLVQIRDRELLDPVPDDRERDRERVDLVRLPRLRSPFREAPIRCGGTLTTRSPAANNACSSRRETARQSSIADTRSSSRSQ